MNRKSDSLAPGTRLDHYIIERSLSRGGFSIVYLARVDGLEKVVAIKEYFPRRIARRGENNEVLPATEDDTERLNHGRKLFFKEAKTLSTLKHPTIVNVFNFFTTNNTVYMVMEYQPGENLETYIKKYNGNLSEKFIRTIFPPLLEGLRVVHETGLMHLDIKPANVHLRPGGAPLLLDFGAVHKKMLSRQYKKNQVVSAGYSPIEQYEAKGYVGPWTDIYALGATMRTCIEGCPPPPAAQRQGKDPMKPAIEAFKRKYSVQLLSTIDWAMEVHPLNRPQNVDEMLEALSEKHDPAESVGTTLKKFAGSLLPTFDK
jgi:serine/threonine protein kinase